MIFWQNEILALFEKYEWAVCAIGAILCMIKLENFSVKNRKQLEKKQQKNYKNGDKKDFKRDLLMEYA